MRASLAAPETAVSAIRHIGTGRQRKAGHSTTKPAPSCPARRRSATAERYDPRKRPWFRDAMAAETTILTEPYIFAITGQLGLTIATKLPGGDGVIGADMTFDDIARFAREMHFSASSIVVLFTRDGWVLGHGRARVGGGRRGDGRAGAVPPAGAGRRSGRPGARAVAPPRRQSERKLGIGQRRRPAISPGGGADRCGRRQRALSRRRRADRRAGHGPAAPDRAGGARRARRAVARRLDGGAVGARAVAADLAPGRRGAAARGARFLGAAAGPTRA